MVRALVSPDVYGLGAPAFQIAALVTLNVTQTTALNFGSAAAPVSGTGTLTLNPATNTRSYDSTGGLLSGSSFSRAVFSISGGSALSSTYNVTLPAAFSQGGSTANFTFYSKNAASSSYGTLSATGNDTLYIGGSLSIPSSATVGTHVGNAGTVIIEDTVGVSSGSGNLNDVTWKTAQPLSLVKVTDLNFGDVVAGAGAGTVLVSSAGVRTVTGGTLLGNTANVSAGSFTLNGEPNAVVSLTVSPAELTITSGANSMTVDTWVLSPSSPATLPAVPPTTIRVGATLHVGASQPQGSYSGIFDVTANYQ